MSLPRRYPSVSELFEAYNIVATAKLTSIVSVILAGGRPAGCVNLFADLDVATPDPPVGIALQIVNRLNRLNRAVDSTPEVLLRNHNYWFYAEYRRTSCGTSRHPERGTVVVMFCSCTPDTAQRVFEPDND